MFRNEALIDKYTRYVKAQIAFGESELRRTENKHNDALWKLANYYYNTTKEKHLAFIEQYDKQILKRINYYRKKGRLEIIATSGTHCFLPFYAKYPEVLRAQFETALEDYAKTFGAMSAGFYLPELGFSKALEPYLHRYGINYTVIDAHAAALADPPAKTGSFYPLRLRQGCFLLVRDHQAWKEVAGNKDAFYQNEIYCDDNEDIGFKLDEDLVKDFIDMDGKRCPTGYRYLRNGDKDDIYDRSGAKKKALADAAEFIRRREAALITARSFGEENPQNPEYLMDPVSVCVWDAGCLGTYWQEGIFFLEEVLRRGASNEALSFATPSEYLCRQDSSLFQTISPEFTSSGINGYGEAFIDKPNDWIYRHLYHAIERMIELAGRFNDETGLKATALNQAARELLLSQASDWIKISRSNSGGTVWNEQRVLAHLRNFTTIYESLGGDYLSTKLLAELGATDGIFPRIKYHIFKRQAPAN
jgi:1,4-alpha-glucan branching enzyme